MFNKAYGIDAPPVIRHLAVVAIVAFGIATGSFIVLDIHHPILATILLILFLMIGIWQLVMLLWMLYSSLAGKMIMRDKLIAGLQLNGNETLLDIGCGRGLLLIAAAKHLSQGGQAVGLDLWSKADLSANSEQQTMALIQKEQVADRIILKTGDMRQMPFFNEQFDIIISSMAIHNITKSAERKQAFAEITRVLKPGGKIALLDFQFTKEYIQHLKALGWHHVHRSKRYWRMFPPVHIVSGKK